MITLYRRNAFGIGCWSIWCNGNVITISHSSVVGGSPINHTETVERGKQGRSISDQVESRINSRVSNQRDKGYVENLDEAAKGAFNQLGLLPPMLAKVYKGSIDKSSWIQRKINGLRCLITRQDGVLIAYSRRGKTLLNIDKILSEAELFIAEGDTFDGELYSHGESLQTIASWVKRKQFFTDKLEWIIYDKISSDTFSERHDELLSVVKPLNLRQCKVLPKIEYIDQKQCDGEFKSAISDGFEGLMIRLNGVGYESNKRSNSLQKYKPCFDTEVVVKDILLSEKGNPVCIVSYKDVEFKLSPPGSKSDRLKAYNDKINYIGRQINIEFRELTDDGVPFHAAAINWRTEI